MKEDFPVVESHLGLDIEEIEALKGDEKKIECRSCKKLLGTLFVTIEPELIKELNKPLQAFSKKMQWLCPCGDKSYVAKSAFKTFFIPEDDVLYSAFKKDGEIFITKLVSK